MPIYARKPKTDYVTAPEGLWLGVCVDVEDLGMQDRGFGPKPMVRIWWMLGENEDLPAENGKPFEVSQSYNNSLHEKANLCKMLVQWRGKKFTPQELDEFDLERLIGANGQIQVQHNITDKGTYANVVAVVPPPRGIPKIAIPNDYVRRIDRTKRADLEASPDGNGYHPVDADVPF